MNTVIRQSIIEGDKILILTQSAITDSHGHLWKVYSDRTDHILVETCSGLSMMGSRL